MKRILSFILILMLLLPMLISCLRPAKKLPADFVDGDEIVIDNETPFVYDESKLYDDTVKIKFSNGEILDLSPCAALDFFTSYQEFARYFGNKVIRHYKTETEEYYYTVYSLTNYQLLYLYLMPEENGDLLLKELEWSILDSRTRISEGLMEKDQPSTVLNGKLPDYCYLDYYSAEEISKKNEILRNMFAEYCYSTNLPSYEQKMTECYQNGGSFYRCIQYVTFDTVNQSTHLAQNGLYTYDLQIYADNTGTLTYRHLIHETAWTYTLEQEETVALSPTEVSRIKDVIVASDFENIPTWNPEEFRGVDGNTTFIMGGRSAFDSHLISMWEPSKHYGIYQIRTAIEDIVRERIEVTSGRIYTN